MYQYPFRGKYKITCPFGKKGSWKCGWHIGVDIVGIGDIDIYPISDGVVESINAKGSAYGKHICINHDDGMVSLYAHLKSIEVQKGERVNMNSLLGLMGATGNASGSHLHLELHKDEYRYPKGDDAEWVVDPIQWIEEHMHMCKVDKLTILNNDKKVEVDAVNIDGTNYIKLRDMEKLCDVVVGYRDGIVTVDKKKNEFKAYNYAYKQTSRGRTIATHQLRVWEVDPMMLKAKAVKTNLNTVDEKYMVNAGYGWWEDSARRKPYGLSVLVSEGEILCNSTPHGDPCGCLIVYKDGSCTVKKVGNIAHEKNVWFAVGGMTVCPTVESNDEGFIGVYADVLRECPRVAMGWNPTKRKVMIVGYSKMAAVRARDALNELGCVGGITLDAGGSTIMKENGKYILKSDGRTQFGCVFLEGD